jgi:hypothetical protein
MRQPKVVNFSVQLSMNTVYFLQAGQGQQEWCKNSSEPYRQAGGKMDWVSTV